MKEYHIHNLSSDVVITVNAFSPEQALLLTDFHENKNSLLALLDGYIKNNDLDTMKERHKFIYGKKTIGYGDWCIKGDLK